MLTPGMQDQLEKFAKTKAWADAEIERIEALAKEIDEKLIQELPILKEEAVSGDVYIGKASREVWAVYVLMTETTTAAQKILDEVSRINPATADKNDTYIAVMARITLLKGILREFVAKQYPMITNPESPHHKKDIVVRKGGFIFMSGHRPKSETRTDHARTYKQ